VVVLGPDVYEFSWRYELPAVVVLVPAGVLGLSVLWTWRRERKQPAAGAEPVTDAQA
jgi:hypothetical protein